MKKIVQQMKKVRMVGGQFTEYSFANIHGDFLSTRRGWRIMRTTAFWQGGRLLPCGH